MRVYRIVSFVVDHDDIGPDGYSDMLNNARYPNHIPVPRILSIEERDCGEWDDAHPLNNYSTCDAEIARLFGDTPQRQTEGL